MDSIITPDIIKTIDHEEIRKWIESHKGRPAVSVDAAEGGVQTMLRIEFPPYAEADSKEITWDEFFNLFEENSMSFSFSKDSILNPDEQYYKFVLRD